jgi:uncharacterized heparinase superfamily protein
MPDAELMRLARTVARLRPAQVGQRLRLRTQRLALDHSVPLARRWLLSGPDPDSAVGWPAEFAPLDALVGAARTGRPALRAGEVTLLGATRVLAPQAASGEVNWPAADWAMASAPLLWRYHLYYWDWAWELADGEQPAAALFAALWRSWSAAVAPGYGPAWHPYPVALRAWSLCGLYRAVADGGAAAASVRAELAGCLGFLRRNLETDVGGNHLVKNLKALAGLAVFFADGALLRVAMRRLRRQLVIQVLPDGGHYERAPAYHCQVLGDLLDIAGLLHAVRLGEFPELRDAIAAMRAWLGAVLTPDGRVPLLNDGFPVNDALLAALAPTRPAVGPLRVLPDTGLGLATAGDWFLLADIGAPCPANLPAHAHADTLGCLAYLRAEPLLIDTGTSTYAAGPVRDRERSTAAHNTVQLGRHDSTEVWGAFRAGRRAAVHGVRASVGDGGVTLAAAHDGYRHLAGRPLHHRRWSLRDSELRIDDMVSGQGSHQVTARWHFAPGSRVRLVPGGAVVTPASGAFTVQVNVSAPAGLTLTIAVAEVSAGFGRTVPVPVLACTVHRELPVAIQTSWRRAEPAQEPA